MFERLREHLSREFAPRVFFFRDDDADRELPELRRLLELFGKREVPLSLAVIPGTLTPDGASLLRASAVSMRLELHQHGWMHVNHEAEGRKCEFGPSRGYEQQRADIASGAMRLKDQLNGYTSPVFTPPWNRCTVDTCRALADLGFAVLSRDASPAIDSSRIPEIPVAVDIFRWKQGPQLKTAAEVEVEIIEAQPCGPVGILLHHKVMSAEAFEVIEQLVDTLRAHPFVRLETCKGAYETR